MIDKYTILLKKVKKKYYRYFLDFKNCKMLVINNFIQILIKIQKKTLVGFNG